MTAILVPAKLLSEWKGFHQCDEAGDCGPRPSSLPYITKRQS
jgi:hypothetical protein